MSRHDKAKETRRTSRPRTTTRRTMLAGAAAMTMSLVPRGQAAMGQADATPTGAARRIEHKYGVTEIAGEPQRVVTVGFSDQDAVLALGVAPIAVTDWYGDYPFAVWPWAQDALGEAEPDVLNRGAFTGAVNLNFEQIAALRPDLIIGLYTGMTEEDYALLSRIAPTVAQSGDYPDYGMPWQEATRATGRALGREEAAEALVAEVEGAFAAARQAHPEFAGKEAAVAERFETGFMVRSPQDPRSRFLTDLGFVIPDEIAELTGERDAADVSEERFDLLDRDLLVWNAGFAPDLADELAVNELYGRLAVAQEGRDVILTDEVLSGALTWSTVLSLPYALEGMVPLLAAALDGDPATIATPTA